MELPCDPFTASGHDLSHRVLLASVFPFRHPLALMFCPQRPSDESFSGFHRQRTRN
jgi:hypothetical protein